MYKCLSCEEEIDEESVKDRVRCPFCGYRVIIKTRPKKVSKVKAR